MFGRRFGSSLVSVGLLITLSSASAWAGGCSLATLKGKYVAFEQGQFLFAVPPAFPEGPFVNAAKATFDGAGHFSGTYVAVVGSGEVREGPFSGTYSVAHDCTYSDNFNVRIPTVSGPIIVPLHHKGFITGEYILQEVHYIYVDPSDLIPGAISGTLKKQ
ncbi:MAG TPA: hypothetical protein VLC12_02565 [Terriglobales bacterium]|nr:hypothetical protein [Terriglobales bacterium]